MKVTDPMDGVTKARYDERGNIACLTDPNGGETTYDKVLSYEATPGRFAYKKVAEVIAHDGVTELAHVTISRKVVADKATECEIASTETGSTGTVISETIDSTTNHPYFVVGYGYVDAGNLIEGDTVLLANGKEAKVDKV